MDFSTITKNNRWLIPAILVFFMGVAFFVRLIPVLSAGSQGFLPIFDTDTWYNLRQIEVMVNHFPQYNWFDPMTAFPHGKVVDWGPLYPILASVLCIVTGSTTHNSIIFMSGWLGPILGVVMVPVMYLLGKTVWNRLAGLIAAGLISIVSYQYFFDSSYGVVDHHIAEVLFTTLFILIYFISIRHVQQNPPDLKNAKTYLLPVLLSSLGGLIWFLALVSSTTVLLLLGVIALFTVIQNILDYFSLNPPDYLLIVNSVFLCTSVFLLFVSGFVRNGTSFTQYSTGLVLVHLALLSVTLFFYGISRLFRNKRGLYVASAAGLAAVSVVLLLFVPALTTIFSSAVNILFGSSQFTVGVQETLPWTLANAFTYFGTSILLATGGMLILACSVWKRRENLLVFLAIWSIVMLFVTIEHQRFQYFLTINIVLLSAVCIAEAVELRRERITSILKGLSFLHQKENPEPDQTVKTEPGYPRSKKTAGKKSPVVPLNKPRGFRELSKDLALAGVVILTVILVGTSFSMDYNYGTTIRHQGTISGDWTESLGWIESETPSPGVEYFQQYEENTFSYPDNAYGIMAVWDAGHWITFFSHRLPITNPFQDNLAGNDGAAAFFLSKNETRANDILTSLRGKYVVTNSGMTVDIFTGLVPWVNPASDISPYIKYFLKPDPGNPSHLSKVHLYDNEYFQTLAVRLYMFDGSMTMPSTADYLQYIVRKVPAPGETSGDVNGYARVITVDNPLDISRGLNGTTILSEEGGLSPQRYANVFSRLPDKPVREVPALKHYRLVHESPEDSTVVPFPESTPFLLPDIKQVKIFEFVGGAHISGNGIIEVPLTTNTGRTFVYRQQSEGGEFVVPYSTIGNKNGVKTTAPYHIVGTSRYFNVTEEDIVVGNTVTESR